MGISFLVFHMQERLLATPANFIEARNYMTPNRFRMTRMMAITIRVWIQLPVFGKLGLIFAPKKPNSHRMTRITMMVYNMRFLLFDLSDSLYNLAYNKPSPAASNGGGGFVSATWGRQIAFRN
jgi:hypothetical protein